MSTQLNNKNIAILVTNGFEEVELTEPRKALEEAGATTFIISPELMTVSSWKHTHWGSEFEVDTPLDESNAQDFDALLLPGGVLNPDKLRTNDQAIQFAAAFLHAGKPVAAICHGPQLLIETGELNGRTMTSYHSIRTDLINAGVNWKDKEVVVDKGLITSRNPQDIPVFNETMIEAFAADIHKDLASN
ncbi:MAG TPA: type 1 glutamine amidotransferase domain-containing protein [Fodinibius sp.]|nr:type 1 glutamine amidotransferase domain-containing protein [Fodinibius sp.]